MERTDILERVVEPQYRKEFQWTGQDGAVQFYESSRTGTALAIDADTGRFYDGQMREIHPVDALASVGIYSPNPVVTEQINAHVHEGREDVFQQSMTPVEDGPTVRYRPTDFMSRGMYGDGYLRLEQHRYTGGLIQHDGDGHFVEYAGHELRAISRHEALAGVVNYGPSDGTLEKLPAEDLAIIRRVSEPRFTTMSAEEYQALRAESGPEWRHSVRVETPPPGLDGHYANDPNQSPEHKIRIAIADDLYVYNEQRFFSPQLYDSMLAMNGPEWRHRVVVGPEEAYTLESLNARYSGQRTAPEQNPATALSVEAAYPRDYIAPTYEQALERWENAVHLHEDLRGRPLTPQEYQQQVEINGPRWQHDVVLAQPVDGTQNLYDRPYTQITPDDQILAPGQYGRLLQYHVPNWQHSVIVREPFPLDPDARFQQAHRDWLEANEIFRENDRVPISPQEYQARQERRAWHEDSTVVVTPPLAPGLQWDDRSPLRDPELSRMEGLSHPEYEELVRANGPAWRHSVVVLEPPPQHFGMELPTSWRAEPMRLEQESEEKIVPYATTDWMVEPGGAWEHRIHFGKSDEGHHYATEMSYLGGDYGGSGEPAWSLPYASHQEASHAAHTTLAETLSGDTEHGISIG